MAKRSPILGYNHNVRYRGLIFHVQTEDSGLASPHLFTHLFHGGVIVSTRKLVYDAGSAEEAIKALMQAQHKAVLKDLRKGTFDEKIEEYLGATPGLLPRGSNAEGGDEAVRDSEPVLPPPIRAQSEPEGAPGHDTDPQLPTPPREAVHAAPATARTQTAERRSAPSQVRTTRPPPPSDEIDAPTLNDSSIAAAVAAANSTVRTAFIGMDSSPDIEIQLELDDDDGDIGGRTRAARDTDVQTPGEQLPTFSDGVPGAIGGADPAAAHPPPSVPERKTGDRGSAVGAATLPAARPITRPPSRGAISPPSVVSRPLTGDDGRPRRESDAVEVYSSAPPSVEPPPGSAPERPGQYAQHKRVSTRIPVELIKGNDRSGPMAIPSGLSRPGRTSASPATSPSAPPTREATASTPPPRSAEASRPPESVRPPDVARPPERARRPTPARVAPASSNPAPSRTGSSQSGGVVMTRPAVIVGAPAKPPVPPRVRKAREEEGRGFGQGLISEKSLDEVILAYLSEDADDK